MKKEFLNKKKTIIIACILLVVIIGSFIGYNIYKQHKIKQDIHNSKTQIEVTYSDFEKAENDKKFDILKSTLKENDDYKSKKHSYKEVLDEYSSCIDKMKKYFIDNYDKELKNNTLSDVDKINDKAKLSSSKKTLNTLLEKIKAKENTALTSKQVKKYEENIKTLTTSYSNRIKAIEEAERKAKEEAERKAKEEAERKAQEEAQRQYSKNKQNYSSSNSNNSNSSGSGNNSYSSNNSSNNSSSSGGNWNDGMELRYQIDENGNRIPGTEFYYNVIDKKFYDLNGNVIGDNSDWVY